jgi:hypothetical protein
MIPANLPEALRPTGLSVYLEVPAEGVQIYRREKNAAGVWAWVHKGPEAALFDAANKPIGKHYGGPTWEGDDGGKVVGAMKADAPSPDGSIPWLLLDIKSRSRRRGRSCASPPPAASRRKAATRARPDRMSACLTRRRICF